MKREIASQQWLELVEHVASRFYNYLAPPSCVVVPRLLIGDKVK